LLAADEGVVPLATAGLIAPRPVATKVTLLPADAFTTAVFAAEGAIPPCAANRPKSDVATPTRKGALVTVPTVTVTFTDGTPAAISNGTWTFNCVGLTKRIGAAMPPIMTEVPPNVSGALGNGTSVVPFVRFVP
jgi:hypothetical protein